MTLSPYVFFHGTCRDAMQFYAGIFGTEPMLMDATGLPEAFQAPEDRRDWIMHGSLEINGGTLLAADLIFNDKILMQGAAISVLYPTAAEAKIIFDKLSDGAEITMAWTATFWSAGFGTLTDKFGTCWMVGTDERPAG